MCWSIDRWGELEEIKRKQEAEGDEGEESVRELLETLSESQPVTEA